ncbi:MAG TPA: late competence development ComFB family protein [Candidatus Angelobacter sp.]|nr:late competence development ComFB family protein [Candidatus Angelobacter sp.]
MATTNVMELLIRDKMMESLHQLPLKCKCQQCLDDVLALTLNKFPPHYASRTEGVAYIKAKFNTRQDSVTLLSQILKSCEIVSSTPTHGN